MERLTVWDEYGNADIIALSDMMPEIYAGLSYAQTNALTDALNRLATYEDAEEQGRLLVLPCKVGDAVYVLVKEGKIKKYIVSGIIIELNNTWIDIREIDNPYGGSSLNAVQFGADVFLTREEAEAALKAKEKAEEDRGV